MNKEECYQVGYVMKTHGYQGSVLVFMDVDHPDEYDEMDSVFLEVEHQLVPYMIEEIRINRQQAIIKFEEVDTLEQAAELKGCGLFLPLDQLPDLEPHQFYYHEIIGFTVVDTNLGTLGKVANVYNLPHQDLLVMDYKQKEVLIPLTDEIVQSVDRETQLVNVTLPDGLLEVYLEE